MHLTIDRKLLLDALATAQSVADRKSTTPILTHARLIARDAELEITATDLYSTFRVPLAANVSAPGSCALPAQQFYALIKSLDADAVTLKADDTHHVTVSAGSGRFKLLGMPARDFPKSPDVDGCTFEAFPASTLAKLIKSVEHSICQDQTRTALCGVLLVREGARCRAASTDGHTMAVGEADVPGAPLSMNIPHRQVRDLLQAVSSAVTVEIAVGVAQIAGGERRRHLHVRADGALLSLALRGDGETFPPYEQVIPRSHERSATINRDVLLASLRRVLLLAGDGGGLKIGVEDEALTLGAEHPDKGEATERMQASCSGPPLLIGLSGAYLLRAIEQVETAQVRLEFGGELAPCAIKPADGNSFLGVVMPMRL